MIQREIICIGCPLGCHVMLTIDSDCNVESARGNQCKEGLKHAKAELQHPVRVLTATVLTEGSERRLLPVRTDKAVSKEKLNEIMQAIKKIKVNLRSRQDRKSLIIF